jgi:hypothetical protein
MPARIVIQIAMREVTIASQPQPSSWFSSMVVPPRSPAGRRAAAAGMSAGTILVMM